MQTLRSTALRIPAQPFDYQLPFERAALVIIDMQRDFLEPGGFGETLGNDVHAVKAIVPRVQIVLEAWRAVGGFVVHTREEHRPDLTDCPPAKRDRGSPSQRIGDHGPMGRILIAGEPGTAIVSELQPIAGELVISKPGKGAFYATDLQEELKKRNISHLILLGVTTEVCVQSTMREANDRGFECLLLSDCTASFFPAFKEATLAMVTSQGAIVGWTAPSQALLAVLGDER